MALVDDILGFGDSPLDAAPARSRRIPPRAIVGREKAQSLIEAAAEGGLNLLQGIGHILDTPGAYVRGVLAGTPGKRADPSVLREQWNLNTGNAWADLAVDLGIGVLFDPLSAVVGPAKALTGGPRVFQAAKRAGETLGGRSPALLANEIAAGKRGLLGLKVPAGPARWIAEAFGYSGGDAPVAVLGSGSSLAADFVRSIYYNPISSSVRQLFDHRVRGVYDSGAQAVIDATEGLLEKTAAETALKGLGIQRTIGDIQKLHIGRLKSWLDENPALSQKLLGTSDLSGLDADSLVRAVAEIHPDVAGEYIGSRKLAALAERMSLAGQPGKLQDAIRAVDEVADELLLRQDAEWLKYQMLGGTDANHVLRDSQTYHMARNWSDDLKAARGFAGKDLNKIWPGLSRKITEIPGGTYLVNRIAKDPLVSGETAAISAPFADRVAYLVEKYGIPEDSATHLAGLLGSFPDSALSKGLFGRSTVEDVTDYLATLQRKNHALMAGHKYLVSVADEAAMGPSVKEAMRRIGIGDSAEDYFRQQYAAAKGVRPIDVNLDVLKVPEGFVDVAQKVMYYTEQPEKLGAIGTFWKKFKSLFQSWQYSVWPGSHIRNFVSGVWQNYVTAFRGDADGVRAMQAAHDLLMGRGAAYADEAALMGVMKSGWRDLVTESPGATRIGNYQSILSAFTEEGTTWNPLDVRGFAGLGMPGRETTKSKPFLAGERVADAVETFNRYSHYHALREAGWSPEAAAKSVKLTHYDYSELGHGERKWIAPWFTFYGFARKNLPAQIRAILDEPGGPTAQTIKSLNTIREHAKEKGDFIPERLGEGLAIPGKMLPEWLVGDQSKKGRKSFLVSRGALPVEEAFNRIYFNGTTPDIQRTVENYGAMSPIAQFLSKGIFGYDLYRHRKTDSLYKYTNTPLDPLMDAEVLGIPVGRAVEEAVWSGPASRMARALRIIGDPDKTIPSKLFNVLMGGISLSDIDVEKERRIAALRNLKNLLENELGVGNKSFLFLRKYGPPASKETQEVIRVYQQLSRQHSQQE